MGWPALRVAKRGTAARPTGSHNAMKNGRGCLTTSAPSRICSHQFLERSSEHLNDATYTGPIVCPNAPLFVKSISLYIPEIPVPVIDAEPTILGAGPAVAICQPPAVFMSVSCMTHRCRWQTSHGWQHPKSSSACGGSGAVEDTDRTASINIVLYELAAPVEKK